MTNSTYYTVSPYVVADSVTDYGAGFSYNAATNATTRPRARTLVLSPITARVRRVPRHEHRTSTT